MVKLTSELSDDDILDMYKNMYSINFPILERVLCKYFRVGLEKQIRGNYTVFASLANILPKSKGRPLPASLPKSPHFTRKRCTIQHLAHERSVSLK